MKIRPNDRIGYQGIDYRVDDVLTYALADCRFRLARLKAEAQVLFLELPTSDADDRLLALSEIETLDITTPPPATIYHRGESYLMRMSGAATVTAADGGVRTCSLWRFRAAGDQFLHIEQWPEKVRMFAGPSVHVDMVEMRPATHRDS